MLGEKKIYILLTDTGTVFTKMIKSFTKKPHNHASIAFDADLKEVYSFGRKTPRNPFVGGFVREDINSVLFRQADCAIYSLTISNDDYHKMYRYIKGIECQKECYRYNLLGLIGVLLNKPIKRKNAFFCSQFVATVLDESMSTNFGKDLSLVEPSDILLAADFELVFEGRLREYQYMNQIVQSPYPVVPVGM